MTDRLSAQQPFAAPPGLFLAEEIEARGWTTMDVATRMGGDPAKDLLTVELILAVNNPNLLIGAATSAELGRAFDVDENYFANLCKAWRDAAPDRRMYYDDTEKALIERVLLAGRRALQGENNG